MGYTWSQFTAYLRLARADRARRRVEHLVDTSNAFAGGEGAKKAVRSLSEQADAEG
ncbi:MAG: hypothetical protein Q7U99_17575 [Rubrivivax sp.]|nr:hypothetical protein [Rubrivivax sp.]